MSTMRRPVASAEAPKPSLILKSRTVSRVAPNRPGTIVGWTNCMSLTLTRPTRSRLPSTIRQMITRYQLACYGSGYRISQRKCAEKRLRRNCRTQDGCQPIEWGATRGHSLTYNSSPLLARISQVPVVLEVLACHLLEELAPMHHSHR